MKKDAARRSLLGALDAPGVSRLLLASGDVVVVLDDAGVVLAVGVQDPDLPEPLLQAWVGKAWVDTVTVESRVKIEALLAQAGEAPRWRQVNHPVSGADDLPILYATARVDIAVAGVAPSKAAAAAARAPVGAQAGPGRMASKALQTGSRTVAFGRNLRSTVVLQQRLVESQQAMERDYWRFREAETRYRHLFQTSSEAALIIDAVSQRVLEANPAAQELCGPGAGQGKLVGMSWLSLFDAEALPRLQTLLATARSTGRKDPLRARLAAAQAEVSVSASVFRQDESAFVLVRMVPVPVARRAALRGDTAAAAATAAAGMAQAFLQGASDAIVLTDAQGRVLQANRAFAVMAQVAVEENISGQNLDRWVGQTGVELGVLVSNLRQRGSAGLFVTSVRGEAGAQTQVEIAAAVLAVTPSTLLGFTIRNVERRLKSEAASGSAATRSVGDLTDLVGNVPLKDIVSETTDLIEQLCIETALEMTGDKRSSAALLLGLSRQSLYVKLRRFGMSEQGPEDEAG